MKQPSIADLDVHVRLDVPPVCSIGRMWEQLEDAQYSRRNFFFIEDGQLIMDCSVTETEPACFKACLEIRCPLMLFLLETVIIVPYYAYKPETKDGS